VTWSAVVVVRAGALTVVVLMSLVVRGGVRAELLLEL
jgi:hypothetical protein